MSNSKLAVTQRAQYLDRNGNPVSLGSVTYYDRGTTTLKDIWLDEAKTTAAVNPQILDIGGWVANNDITHGDGGIWYDEGYYDVIVKDSDGAEVWSIENVAGADLSASGTLNFITVETIADMTALDVTKYNLVYVLGYFETDDNGGGWFKLDAAGVQSPNSGTIFSPDVGSGRWLRVVNDTAIRPEMFGAIPNEELINCTTPIASMIVWCGNNEHYSNIEFSAGDYYINGDINFTGDIKAKFIDGARFVKSAGTGESMVTFACSDAIIESFNTPLVQPANGVNPTTNLTFNVENKSREAFVEWWGVDGESGVLSDFLITSAVAGTTAPLVFSGGTLYATDTATSFVTNEVIFRNNSKLTISETTTFAKISIDQSLAALAGDLSKLQFTQQIEVKASWFDISTMGIIDNFKYENLLTALSYQDKYPTIVWDRHNYAFNSALSTIRTRYSHKIQGSILTFNALVNFGKIIECDIGGISSSGTSWPILQNQAVSVRWFGAISQYTSSEAQVANTAAINYALNVQQESDLNKYSYVTGDNERYYLNSAIDITQTASRLAFGTYIEMRDIKLVNTIGFTPVTIITPYMIALRGNVRLERVTIENNISIDTHILYNNGNLRVLDSVIDNFRINYDGINCFGNGDLEIKNSTIEALDTCILATSSRVVISGNKLTSAAIPVNTVNCTKCTLSNNQITNSGGSNDSYIKSTISSVITGNTFNAKCALNISSSSVNTLISGNSFDESGVTIEEPEQANISSNQFINNANVSLTTTATGYAVIGVQITDNSFQYFGELSKDIVSLDGTGSFADTGNDCLIVDNVANGLAYKSTEGWSTLVVNAHTEFGLNDRARVTMSYPSWLILPNADLDLDAYMLGNPYTSGPTDLPLTESAGLISVADYESDYPAGHTVELRWLGPTTDGTLGDYFQSVRVKFRGSSK